MLASACIPTEWALTAVFSSKMNIDKDSQLHKGKVRKWRRDTHYERSIIIHGGTRGHGALSKIIHIWVLFTKTPPPLHLNYVHHNLGSLFIRK